MALRNCVKDINFMDPVQMRRIHRNLIIEVSIEAWYISNKYNVWVDPLNFEWDTF